MDYQRMHFLLSMSCDAAVHSVEMKLVESGFRVMNREASKLPSVLGERVAPRRRYELTVVDTQAATEAETPPRGKDRFPRIVIEASRGAYTEVFLAPAEIWDDGMKSERMVSLSNDTAVRIARVLLDVGRLAFISRTKETSNHFDDRITL